VIEEKSVVPGRASHDGSSARRELLGGALIDIAVIVIPAKAFPGGDLTLHKTPVDPRITEVAHVAVREPVTVGDIDRAQEDHCGKSARDPQGGG